MNLYVQCHCNYIHISVEGVDYSKLATVVCGTYTCMCAWRNDYHCHSTCTYYDVRVLRWFLHVHNVCNVYKESAVCEQVPVNGAHAQDTHARLCVCVVCVYCVRLTSTNLPMRLQSPVSWHITADIPSNLLFSSSFMFPETRAGSMAATVTRWWPLFSFQPTNPFGLNYRRQNTAFWHVHVKR